MHEVELARSIKKMTHAPLVLGGSGFSIYPHALLRATDADFGIKGAGEHAFVSLLQGIEKGTAVSGIPGCVFRADGEVTVNRCADALPPSLLPWRPENLAAYYLRSSAMLNVQTQRGCSFTCCYCSYPLIEGRVFYRRSPEEIVHECELIKAAGARYFFIVDSVFNTSPDHAAGTCEELVRREIGLSWGCFLRPKGLTPDLVDLMARAGMKHVEFGSDSFSDPVLDAYGKEFTFADVHASSEMTRHAKIHYSHFLIVGGPGETEQTLRESFENSKRLKKTVMFPFVGMRLYPHTPLWHKAVREGIVAESAELFEPFFYVSPRIAKDRIFELLRGFGAQSMNWIVDGPSPEVLRVTSLLRDRGVQGPLWEFLAR
jgi:radical SAM superfamily enzyme YgiQ (UPF0313 family)